jgi:hypothetical protein
MERKRNPYCGLSALILILALFIPTACLQPANEIPNLEYIPQSLKDVSADFNVSAGSDMIIVQFEGGAFQNDVAIDDFTFRGVNGTVSVDALTVDAETLAILSFDTPLRAGTYNLTIRANAFIRSPGRLVVEAVNGNGTWSVPIGNTGFNRSPIYAIAYGAGKYLAVGGGGNLSYSRDGAVWINIPPGFTVTQSQFPQDCEIRTAAYGNGTFYVMGTGGRVGFSAEGQNWEGYTESMFDHSLTINAVIYGDGKFLAAGDDGRMMYMTDDGGWPWVSDNHFGNGAIRALAWGRTEAGESRYVAGGVDTPTGGGKLSWSGDGINWTWSVNLDKRVNGLAYGQGVFVAVTDDGKIYQSVDGGVSWAGKYTVPGGTGLLSVVYGSGRFIAAGHNGVALVSADGGDQWMPMSVSFSTSDQISCAAYIGGRFFLAGNPYHEGENSRIVSACFKPSGQVSPLPPVENVTSSPFYLNAGDTQVTLTLTGGAFMPMPVETDFDLTNAGFTGGTIVRDRNNPAVLVFRGITVTSPGANKTITIRASALSAQARSASVTTQTNLVWTKVEAASQPFNNSNIRGIAYGNNKYVAVGAGKIATSTDGITWTEVPSPSGDNRWAEEGNYVDFQGIAYGNGRFIAVGYWLNGDNGNGWGVAATSTDGTNWTTKDKVLTNGSDSAHVYAITWTGTNFVAVGRWGRSATSTDGTNWTTRQIEGFNWLDNQNWWENAYAVAADGTGKVIAGGANGKLSWSTDHGVTWTWAADLFFGENRAIRTILFTNNTFIAAGEGGNMKRISSTGTDWQDGDKWQGVNSEFGDTHIWALGAGGGRIIATGDNGMMSESVDGSTWTALAVGEGSGQSGFTSAEQITCIVYGGTKFIIGGNAYSDRGNASKLAYSN